MNKEHFPEYAGLPIFVIDSLGIGFGCGPTILVAPPGYHGAVAKKPKKSRIVIWLKVFFATLRGRQEERMKRAELRELVHDFTHPPIELG